MLRAVGMVPPGRALVEKRVKVMAAEIASEVGTLEEASRRRQTASTDSRRSAVAWTVSPFVLSRQRRVSSRRRGGVRYGSKHLPDVRNV
ncbi:MAG: hypothetical protein V3V08_11390 [Nannocystaceae bacterium]